MTATAPAQTERAFQQQVVELAGYCGWLVYHPFDSRRSAAGWPDLALCRPPRLILAELKTDKGRVRPEQQVWLDALRTVAGVEVHLWRPSDFDEVTKVLA